MQVLDRAAPGLGCRRQAVLLGEPGFGFQGCYRSAPLFPVIVGPVVTVSSKPLPFGCMYLKLLMFFVMPGLSKGCAEM
jgi:hypothetical protein